MNVKKSLMALLAVLYSYQATASNVTVASLLTDGFEIKAMTKSNYDSLVILQKKDKAYVCLISDISGTKKSCKILN